MSKIVIVGGGPAGLMAAERAALRGHNVILLEAKPSVGRKFLMAGVGGLNITHSEDYASFLNRYHGGANTLRRALDTFTPSAYRNWCHSLGIDTFVGSSGRVFPTSMKASPLLRAWLKRLNELGVTICTRHRWTGLDGHTIKVVHEGHNKHYPYEKLILATGGASWSNLGSDGKWTDILAAQSLSLVPFEAANCGFVVNWSPYMASCYGKPLKNVELSWQFNGTQHKRVGELRLDSKGIEGGLVYFASNHIRRTINEKGYCDITLNLLPNLSRTQIEKKLCSKPEKKSLSAHLKSKLKLSPAALTLFNERRHEDVINSLCSLKLRCIATFPLERAISSVGGVGWDLIDDNFQILPDVYAIGEMLDWDAPTGGYLLTACMAMGYYVGNAV
ncbi:MAG: TIGR03862 family flavoprotein [Gammaproteobacteria bacterium]|nr:TIGR03862 family flavoprotein [Gammaproteobacteria bacterium]